MRSMDAGAVVHFAVHERPYHGMMHSLALQLYDVNYMYTLDANKVSRDTSDLFVLSTYLQEQDCLFDLDTGIIKCHGLYAFLKILEGMYAIIDAHNFAHKVTSFLADLHFIHTEHSLDTLDISLQHLSIRV